MHSNIREPENVFRNEGNFWTLTFSGQTVRLRNQRGLTYLANLVSQPYVKIHAALLRANTTDSKAIQPFKGDEVLDKQAMETFKTRYDDLCSELQEAQSNNDPVRQNQIQDERAALGREVTGAIGLGQRQRRMGDEADKIRKAVCMAITRTLTVLDKKHPSLARHLEDAIQMGQVLIYNPATKIDWTF